MKIDTRHLIKRKLASQSPAATLHSSDPVKPMRRGTMSKGNGIPFTWDASSQKWREGVGQ